jgi:hypothetical protein
MGASIGNGLPLGQAGKLVPTTPLGQAVAYLLLALNEIDATAEHPDLGAQCQALIEAVERTIRRD